MGKYNHKGWYTGDHRNATVSSIKDIDRRLNALENSIGTEEGFITQLFEGEESVVGRLERLEKAEEIHDKAEDEQNCWIHNLKRTDEALEKAINQNIEALRAKGDEILHHQVSEKDLADRVTAAEKREREAKKECDLRISRMQRDLRVEDSNELRLIRATIDEAQRRDKQAQEDADWLDILRHSYAVEFSPHEDERIAYIARRLRSEPDK